MSIHPGGERIIQSDKHTCVPFFCRLATRSRALFTMYDIRRGLLAVLRLSTEALKRILRLARLAARLRAGE